jgi:predicted kinase
MPECVFLCGIPCSGKSTYVNKLKKIPYWENAIVLSTDNYIEKVAQEHNTTYREIFEDCIDEATRQLELAFIEAKDKGRNLIWDQTNLSRKTRKKKLSKLPSYYHRGVIYFQVSLEDALERNKHREGKFIPESILKRMWHQFEIPTLGEGFDYVESGNKEEFRSRWHRL